MRSLAPALVSVATLALGCGGDLGPADLDADPCHAGLPDLDGSGAADAADCALIGVGAAVRAVCAGLAEWSALELCHGVSRHVTAASDFPVRAVLAGPDRDRMAVLIQQPQGAVRLWMDADADGEPDEGEVRRLAFTSNVATLAADENGCLAVAGTQQIPSEVLIWHDRDCDLMADTDEQAIVSPLSSGRALVGPPLVGFHQSRTVLVFHESGGGGQAVVAWWDMDGNGEVDAGEHQVIVEGSNPRLLGVRTIRSGSDRILEVQYATWTTSGAAVFVWRIWPQSWGSPSVGEIPGQACFAAEWFDREGTQEVQEASVDACALIGDGVRINGGALLPYLLFPNARPVVGADATGRAYVLFPTMTERVFWIDHNRDGLVAPVEVIVRSRQRGVGPERTVGTVIDGAPVFVDWVLFGETGMEVERWWPLVVTRYLGESCIRDSDRCTSGLECRTSGDAVETHCVPIAEQ